MQSVGSGRHVAYKGCCCMKEEKGAQLYLMVCARLQTELYLMVGTQLLLLWLELQPSSCHRPFIGTPSKTTDCLFLCLQGVADALPGMAMPV
jgi:hypothetical protein